MQSPPDWSDEEFAVLLASMELESRELSETLLKDRSPGAIDVVRQGIKLYGQGTETHGILSRMMTEFLGQRPLLAEWASRQVS